MATYSFLDSSPVLLIPEALGDGGFQYLLAGARASVGVKARACLEEPS